MLKRVIGRRLFDSFYVNLHVRTHKYFKVGVAVKPEKLDGLLMDHTIYSLSIDFYFLFVDVYFNVNWGGKK